MIGYCNGCGQCCDPVMLPYSQRDVQMMLPGQFEDAETRRWVLEDLIPLTYRDGLRRRAELGTRRLIEQPFFYVCRNFDPETRECRIYDRRPQPCRDFPWGINDDKPTPHVAIPLDCSYRLDLYEQPVELVKKGA